MNLPRRQFLHLAAAAAALPAVPPIAWAQPYPTRPARLIVPAPAGGGYDIVARLISQFLSERLGAPFIVDNDRARVAISAPRLSCVHLRTATRSSWSLRQTRSTRRSTR